MRVHSRWRHLVALGVATPGFPFAAIGVEPNAAAAPAAITVAAPPGSRLGAELKRELAFSAFIVDEVVFAPDLVPARDSATAPDWREQARQLVSAERPRVVALRADERQMIVLSRSANSDGVQASFDLQLDPDDRSTRRRACLAAVEYLRVLAEGDERAAVAQAPGPTPEIRASAETTRTEQIWSEPPIDVPSVAASPQGRLPWTMGVGTTLDVSSMGGTPGGHVQFLWYFPLRTRLALRARVQWPVVGASFQAAGADVRMWTFGAAMSVQYSFADAPSLWRPFLGLAIGNRIGLTEASSSTTLEDRTAVTPSANLGLEGGVRYALGSRAQLFGEVEVTRDWLEPTTNRMDYEKAAANAMSLHTSLGILFEY